MSQTVMNIAATIGPRPRDKKRIDWIGVLLSAFVLVNGLVTVPAGTIWLLPAIVMPASPLGGLSGSRTPGGRRPEASATGRQRRPSLQPSRELSSAGTGAAADVAVSVRMTASPITRIGLATTSAAGSEPPSGLLSRREGARRVAAQAP